MENELLKRQLLLMKYDMEQTLSENLMGVNHLLSEDGMSKAILKGVEIGVEDVRGIFNNMVKDGETLKNLQKIEVGTVEGLLNAIKGNRITPELLGDFYKSAMKGGTTNVKLIEKSAEEFVKSEKFVDEYFKFANNESALRNKLKKEGFSETAIDDIVNKTKGEGKLKPGVESGEKVVQDIEKGKNIKSKEELIYLETGKGKWEGIKKLAKEKNLNPLKYVKILGWANVLKYIAGGWLLWWIWSNWFSKRPKHWSDCLLRYIGYNKFSKVTKDEGGGVISVYSYTGVKALDMNGYTYFKNDGTATNGQFEGTWECDNGKLVLEFDGEEYYPVKKEGKKEEKKGEQKVTPTPAPIPNQSMYKECNSFPYTKYCKSPIVKEVQKCLGVTDDSYFGPITDEVLFRQYGTHSLTQSIYKQIMAKCGGNTSNTSNMNQNNVSNVNDDNVLQSTPSTDEV